MAFPFARQQAMAASRAVRPEDIGEAGNKFRCLFRTMTTTMIFLQQTSSFQLFERLILTTKCQLRHVHRLTSLIRQNTQVHPARHTTSNRRSLIRLQPLQHRAKLHHPCWGPVQGSSTAAPATQAAQNLVAGVNLQYGSRKLRKQQERAARKGARALRFGQMGGVHNALRTSLPPYLRRGALSAGGGLS